MKNLRQCINAHGKAKKMNKNPKFIYKQVAYKCKTCLKFHTGRSRHNTLLNHKNNIFNLNK